MDMPSLQHDLQRAKPSLPPPSLTTDFKAAAIALTKLYQNSAPQIDQAREEGYLAAVQEVASLLSQGELAGDHLREWCAVGLSRITAQQDEENRSRPTHSGSAESHEDGQRVTNATEGTPIPRRIPLRSHSPFMDSEPTLQSSSPVPEIEMGVFHPFGTRMDTEVTYEAAENNRCGNRRKRGVNLQLGSSWDVGGSKKFRHM